MGGAEHWGDISLTGVLVLGGRGGGGWGLCQHQRSTPGPAGQPSAACCANVTRLPAAADLSLAAPSEHRSIDLNNIMIRLT